MNVNKRKKDNKPEDDNDEKEKGKAKRSKIVISDHDDDDDDENADVDVVGDGSGADLTDSDVYRAEAPEKEKERPSLVSSSSSSSATAVASLPSAASSAASSSTFTYRKDSDGFHAGKQTRCRCTHKDCESILISEKLHSLHWQISHGGERCLKPEFEHSYRCRVDPCGDTSVFTHPKDRSRHEQAVHGVNKQTKRTPQFYFLTGHNIHGSKFCCRFCFAEFDHLQSRNKHELVGCKALFKSVKCYHKGCSKRFRSIEDRDIHSRECKPASQPVKLARGLDMGTPDDSRSTGCMYFTCTYNTACKEKFHYYLHPTDEKSTKTRRSSALNARDRHHTRHRQGKIKQKKEDTSADKTADKSTASLPVDGPIYVLRPKTVVSSSSSAAAWSPSDIYALPLSGQPIEKMMNSSSIPVPITTRTTTTTTQTTTTTVSLGYPSASSSSSSSSTGEKPKKSLSSGLLVKSFSMGGGDGGDNGNGDVSQFGDLDMLALAATPLMIKGADGNDVSLSYPFVPESQNPVVTASQAKQIIDFTSADADNYSGLLPLDDQFTAAANPLETQPSFPFS
jgi:hypothetical protein